MLVLILSVAVFAADPPHLKAVTADLSLGSPKFSPDGRQVGWRSNDGTFRRYDADTDTFGPPTTEPVIQQFAGDDALDEVNAVRASRGLRPFIRDAGLTAAALGAARHRAASLCQGHTANDFAFLPPGSHASAAGCAAWEPSWGWGACCTFDGHAFAGAAWAWGRDGRRYMHLYVR